MICMHIRNLSAPFEIPSEFKMLDDQLLHLNYLKYICGKGREQGLLSVADIFQLL
jgi:hypothetical protein